MGEEGKGEEMGGGRGVIFDYIRGGGPSIRCIIAYFARILGVLWGLQYAA